MKPGKNTVSTYGTFVIVPPLFTAVGARERGRILTDYVDYNRKRETSLWLVVLGQCVLCVSGEVL